MSKYLLDSYLQNRFLNLNKKLTITKFFILHNYVRFYYATLISCSFEALSQLKRIHFEKRFDICFVFL